MIFEQILYDEGYTSNDQELIFREPICIELSVFFIPELLQLVQYSFRERKKPDGRMVDRKKRRDGEARSGIMTLSLMRMSPN
jgi:hypothetical protein